MHRVESLQGRAPADSTLHCDRFVYFGKEDAGADQQMWRTFAEHQREEQPWLLHAFVDVDSNPELAQRFDIKTTHAFILFRNSKVLKSLPPTVS